MNRANGKAKRRPTAVAASAQDIVLKRLPTLVASCKAPICATEGVLSGVRKFEAMVSTVGTRKGSQSILAGLAPLMEVVRLAKTYIRRRGGIIVTQRMQRDLREALGWQAEECHAALRERVHGPRLLTLRSADDAAIGTKIIRNLARLAAKCQACTIQRNAPSAPASGDSSTSRTRSCSSSSNPSGRPSSASSATHQRSFRTSRNVAPVCPGAAFVAARRVTVEVDPRATHLARSGAVVCR